MRYMFGINYSIRHNIMTNRTVNRMVIDTILLVLGHALEFVIVSVLALLLVRFYDWL